MQTSRRKELLRKFPDLKSFKTYEFSNKKEFKQFCADHSAILKTIYEISKPISFYNNFEEFLSELRYQAEHRMASKIFLMYKGKEPIGVITGFKDRMKDNQFYVSKFAIKPEYRENGLGTEFMARVFAEINKDKTNYSTIEMIAIHGTKSVNERLTGDKPLKNGKLREFKGTTRYELPKYPSVNTIGIKRIPRPHVK